MWWSLPPTYTSSAGRALLTVAAGSSVGQVEFTAGNVTTATAAKFTATPGSSSMSVTITVEPVTAPTLFDVNLLPGQAASDSSVTVEPDLKNPAPSGGVMVSLSSSNPALAPVPASVVIPAGSYLNTVSITTGTATAVTDVTITATLPSGSVSGGGTATATATLTVAAPAGGAQVLLASSNTSAAAVPAIVTVPAGATSATFTMTTASVSSTTTVSIGGEYGNSDRAALFSVTGGRHGGSVLPPPPSGISITPFEFGPMPENDAAGASPHPFLITLPASTLPASDVSIESGSLPPGLSLNAGTAGMVGTPSAQGLFAFVLKFNLSGTVFAMPYVWQIVAPLVITQVNLPAGQVGVPYSGGFSVTGGVPPYTWSIIQAALPPGLTINSSTGQITGTPTTAGTFSFRAQVTDSDETQFSVDSAQSITISS